MKPTYTDNSGYATLVTVLLLTLALLTIASTLAVSNYAANSGIEELTAKEQSYFLAYTCIERARFYITQSRDYEGNETLQIGEDQCQILYVTKTDYKGEKKKKGKYTLIDTSASVHGNTTFLRMNLNAILSPISFSEI